MGALWRLTVAIERLERFRMLIARDEELASRLSQQLGDVCGLGEPADGVLALAPCVGVSRVLQQVYDEVERVPAHKADLDGLPEGLAAAEALVGGRVAAPGRLVHRLHLLDGRLAVHALGELGPYLADRLGVVLEPVRLTGVIRAGVCHLAPLLPGAIVSL